MRTADTATAGLAVETHVTKTYMVGGVALFLAALIHAGPAPPGSAAT